MNYPDFEAATEFLGQPVLGGLFVIHWILLALGLIAFGVGFFRNYRRVWDNGVRAVPVGSYTGRHGGGLISEFQQVCRPFRRSRWQRVCGGIGEGVLFSLVGLLLSPFLAGCVGMPILILVHKLLGR